MMFGDQILMAHLAGCLQSNCKHNAKCKAEKKQNPETQDQDLYRFTSVLDFERILQEANDDELKAFIIIGPKNIIVAISDRYETEGLCNANQTSSNLVFEYPDGRFEYGPEVPREGYTWIIDELPKINIWKSRFKKLETKKKYKKTVLMF